MGKIQRKRKNTFVPQLLDVFIPEDQVMKPKSLKDIFLVMETEQLDLKKFMSGTKNQLTPEHVKFILYNLLCAVNFIHQSNVMHRDLKPHNILINDECQVKICDFGMARVAPGKSFKSRKTHDLALGSYVKLQDEIGTKFDASDDKIGKTRRCLSPRI